MTDRDKHVRLFEKIAFPYSWFFSGQTRSYAACFELGRGLLPDPSGRRALDIGCGTGAFTSALRKEGWQAQGIDAASAMVERATKRGQSCSRGDLLSGLPFPDKTFDLVSAAYVAHGLVAEDRLLLYREAQRLSRGKVLFHDYGKKRRPLTDLVEYLEGGDYFNFIRSAESEMRSVFSDVRVLKVGPQSSWYVCTP